MRAQLFIAVCIVAISSSLAETRRGLPPIQVPVTPTEILEPSVTLLVDDLPDVGWSCVALSVAYDPTARLIVHAVSCAPDRIFMNGVEN